jgi:hypothetical protein
MSNVVRLIGLLRNPKLHKEHVWAARLEAAAMLERVRDALGGLETEPHLAAQQPAARGPMPMECNPPPSVDVPKPAVKPKPVRKTAHPVKSAKDRLAAARALVSGIQSGKGVAASLRAAGCDDQGVSGE